MGRGNQEGNKEREQSGREDGGGRGEAWQAVQRDVPLETENSPAPDQQIFDTRVRGRRWQRRRQQQHSDIASLPKLNVSINIRPFFVKELLLFW